MNLITRCGIVLTGTLSLGVALYAAQPVPVTTGSLNAASSGVWAQIKSLEQSYKANLASLDAQIAPLRQQIQSAQASLKPLQDQRESAVTQFEDQRASLMDQVQPGYQSAYQTEKQGLASAKSQHDQAIASANQQFTSQRQQVIAQFQATVKGLKKS